MTVKRHMTMTYVWTIVNTVFID